MKNGGEISAIAARPSKETGVEFGVTAPAARPEALVQRVIFGATRRANARKIINLLAQSIALIREVLSRGTITGDGVFEAGAVADPFSPVVKGVADFV